MRELERHKYQPRKKHVTFMNFVDWKLDVIVKLVFLCSNVSRCIVLCLIWKIPNFDPTPFLTFIIFTTFLFLFTLPYTTPTQPLPTSHKHEVPRIISFSQWRFQGTSYHPLPPPPPTLLFLLLIHFFSFLFFFVYFYMYFIHQIINIIIL